eukprot:3497937-Heterocapsa_arctica.AAC.1
MNMSTRRTSRTWRSTTVDPLAAIDRIVTHLKRLVEYLFDDVAVQSRRTTELEAKLVNQSRRTTELEARLVVLKKKTAWCR